MTEIDSCYMSNHGPVFVTEYGTFVVTDTEELMRYITAHGHRVHF